MSKKTDQTTLNKCDELISRLTELKKALTTVDSMMAPSARKPINGLGAGWSMDPGTGALHHSTQGIISTFKHPDGYFQIKHGGRSVGRATSPADAGMKIRSYVNALRPGDTGMLNGDPMAMKSEDDEKLDKSNYGPKGAKLYNKADNVKRKANNTGEVAGEGANTNVKSYSSKPGQLSAKAAAAQDAKKAKKLSGPVKSYTPEQIAAYEEAQKLKKTYEDAPWANHASVPNADAELAKVQKNNPVFAGEDAFANQLANMMNSKAMLNPNHRQPSSEDMIMAGERMGLGANQEMLKNADQQWNGALNNWLVEACKPISARFDSPEAEEAYWASIRVTDRDDGKSGH